MAAISGNLSMHALALTAALVIGLGLSSPAAADTTLTYQDQDNNGAQAFVISIQPPHLRMDEAGGMWMLYNGEQDVLFAVNPAEQTYTRMDRKTARQLGGVMDALQEQFKNLPPEQRAAMEQMMGRSLKPSAAKTEYVLTDTTRQRAGVECQVGHLKRDGKLRHEFCMAKPKALGVPEADYAVMTKMFGLMSALRESAGSLFGADIPDPAELQGVAVESSGPEAGHHLLSKVSHDKQPAEHFKLPANYRQEVIPNLTP